jgi:hypothetical protein
MVPLENVFGQLEVLEIVFHKQYVEGVRHG